jgi:hypothetical protein
MGGSIGTSGERAERWRPADFTSEECNPRSGADYAGDTLNIMKMLAAIWLKFSLFGTRAAAAVPSCSG